MGLCTVLRGKERNIKVMHYWLKRKIFGSPPQYIKQNKSLNHQTTTASKLLLCFCTLNPSSIKHSIVFSIFLLEMYTTIYEPSYFC